VLILIGVLSACGRFDTSTPITPSQTPVMPALPGPPGPGHGTIAVRQLSPAAGATLAVESDCPAGRVTRLCTESWQGTFDVTVDRDMTYAVLTVSFYNGDKRCGYGAGTLDIVPAGSRVSFTVTRIVLSDEFGTFVAPCPLPARINRMEATLWSDLSSWSNTLTQGFETAYTFAER
jgi:hypothetical protein